MTDTLAIYSKFDQLEKAAKALQQSGYFKDVTSQAQAIVKVMAGAELGLPPFASMTGINIIQGKPVLGANVLATLVKNDPRYNYQVKQCNGATCELAWFEDGKQVGISSFTWDEAKQAGLTEKDNWRKYPSDMLFARAISRGARRYAPGIFGGSPVYTPDEMGVDTNEEGMIEAVAAEVVHKPGSNESADPIVYEEGLGIANPIDPDEPVVEPVKEKLTVEQARKVIGRKDGKLYGDLSKDDLVGRMIRLKEYLKRKDITAEQREEASYHLEAARVLRTNFDNPVAIQAE